ncbi:alpha/beta hydrolase-fold protein [Nannocystis pusilla]|uniref:alpha/beta hydrolase-fold protein n=1 Tax=Nannocystis pusilla TaxID=889268 RepID=UPI003B7EBF7E
MKKPARGSECTPPCTSSAAARGTFAGCTASSPRSRSASPRALRRRARPRSPPPCARQRRSSPARTVHAALRPALGLRRPRRVVRGDGLHPADYDPSCGWPTLYFVHGFGSSGLRTGAGYIGDVLARVEAGTASPLLRVFLDANHPLGHHVFADSANTGPWSTALVEELLPAIEARYGALAEPTARFLGGHSSGGWASLWLQLEHPGAFGGAWSLAPDPVDFRSFTNVDLYRDANMYRGSDGAAVPLVRDGAKVVTTLEAFVRADPEGRRIYASFDAVFSPAGPPVRCRCSTARPGRSIAPWSRAGSATTSRPGCAESGPRSARGSATSCT